MQCSALILAAGESKRFDGIKVLSNLGGETLLNRIIRQYRDAGFKPIYVALGAYAENIKLTLPNDVHAVHVNDWKKGMGHSLSEAVSQIVQLSIFQSNAKLAIGAADQVNIVSEELKGLIKKSIEQPTHIIAASYNDIQGSPAIFGLDDLKNLRQLTGDQGARSYLKQKPDNVISVRMPSAAFDIDTKDDLHNWRVGREK